MSAASHTQSPLLPPPAATILLYAADGLSVWKKQFSKKGFPRMPERAIWVPMFRELVNSQEGMSTLHALTKSGMQAWRCPPDHLNSLKSAFRDITLRALLIATLEDYAETGVVRIILPSAPSRPQLSPALLVRPELLQRNPSTLSHSPPGRPPTRRSTSMPKPG